jgi:hypothetical protein
MIKIAPANELFFLGFDLPSAKLLARRALEIAYPRFLRKDTLKEPVKVRFWKGAERRGRVAIIVNVTSLEAAREISDQLVDDLVSFGHSEPGQPPYSVVGRVNHEVCLRIRLNADQKLQIDIGKEAAKAP